MGGAVGGGGKHQYTNTLNNHPILFPLLSSSCVLEPIFSSSSMNKKLLYELQVKGCNSWHYERNTFFLSHIKSGNFNSHLNFIWIQVIKLLHRVRVLTVNSGPRLSYGL